MKYDEYEPNAPRNLLIEILVSLAIIPVFIYLGFTSEVRHINYRQRNSNIKVYEVTKIDKNEINSNNEGKLVYLNDSIDKGINPIDQEFNVYINDVLFMTRYVYIYQWEETKNDNNVYYNEKWSQTAINSSNFINKDQKYKNNTYLPYQTKRIYGDLYIGKYKIPNDMLNDLEENLTVELSNSNIKIPTGYQIISNNITNCPSLDKPVNGCIKINYKYNSYRHFTILAKQTGNTFTEYKNNEEKIYYLSTTISTPNEILEKLELVPKKEALPIWVLRFIFALLISSGLAFAIAGIKKLQFVLNNYSLGNYPERIQTPDVNPIVLFIGPIIEIIIIVVAHIIF